MKAYEVAPSGSVQRARRLRRDSTDAERVLWRGLREVFPKAKFRRQSPLGPYIADFPSFRCQLIVEADGGQHDLNAEKDSVRTAYLEAQGYRVLRFWNNDVLGNLDGVLQVIATALIPHPDPLPEGEGEDAQNPSPPGRGRGPSRSDGRVRASAAEGEAA
jgi:very-short-patch-repair endonuclease